LLLFPPLRRRMPMHLLEPRSFDLRRFENGNGQRSGGARMVIGEYGETEADLDARRGRMIAEGKALPDDEFIYIFIV
jgi:hypothetical protein